MADFLTNHLVKCRTCVLEPNIPLWEFFILDKNNAFIVLLLERNDVLKYLFSCL